MGPGQGAAGLPQGHIESSALRAAQVQGAARQLVAEFHWVLRIGEEEEVSAIQLVFVLGVSHFEICRVGDRVVTGKFQQTGISDEDAAAVGIRASAGEFKDPAAHLNGAVIEHRPVETGCAGRAFHKFAGRLDGDGTGATATDRSRSGTQIEEAAGNIYGAARIQIDVAVIPVGVAANIQKRGRKAGGAGMLNLKSGGRIDHQSQTGEAATGPP